MSEFYACRNMKDGHLNECKSCYKLRIREYQRTPKGIEVEARRQERRRERLGITARSDRDVENEKVCRECGKLKYLDSFYRHSQMFDGHLNVCKECIKARAIEYSKTEEGKAVERRRNQKPERKKKLYEQLVKWRKNNPDKTKAQRQRYPEKVRARNLLYKAIRRGEIVKGVCEVCGSEKVHAHHEDYTKPLEVRWFCAKHHYEHHHSEHMED